MTNITCFHTARKGVCFACFTGTMRNINPTLPPNSANTIMAWILLTLNWGKALKIYAKVSVLFVPFLSLKRNTSSLALAYKPSWGGLVFCTACFLPQRSFNPTTYPQPLKKSLLAPHQVIHRHYHCTSATGIVSKAANTHWTLIFYCEQKLQKHIQVLKGKYWWIKKADCRVI